MTAIDPVRTYITKTPGVLGGKACIAGHRIRVLDVFVWTELERKSPDEIVNEYPQLSMAKVHAALAYLWDNRDEILADWEREKSLAAELEVKYSAPLS